MKAQMKWILGVLGVWALAAGLALPAAAGQATQTTDIAKQSDAIVSTYRKIIVLMDGTAALDLGVRERAATTGRILFQENQERLTAKQAFEKYLELQPNSKVVPGVRERLKSLEP